MTTSQTRETMQAYADAFLSFGDYGRYLADEVTMTFMGTDRRIEGRDAVQQALTHVHEEAFSSAIEVKSLICGDAEASIEAEFIGTHIGEFEGLKLGLRAVRVPYSVGYSLAGGRITALRMYFPFELLRRQISVP